MTRRFHIHPLQEGQSEILLRAAEERHLKNVLRLKPGSTVCLFDGKGNEYEGRILDMESSGVRVQVKGDRAEAGENTGESPAHITIAQGFLKEKKMDDLLRPLTELGIRRWLPFIAERSVSRPDSERLKKRKERWEKIVLESLKQCRRSRVPEIGDTLSFQEMLDAGKDADLRLIFWEGMSGADSGTAGESYIFGERKKYQRIFAAIGPEGGFSSAEIREARKAGFRTAGLGPRILKAETAAPAACTLLQHYFGDL